MGNSPHRALLVNPWIHDFAAYDYWLKPLGLLILSSHLKNHGWSVETIDLLDRHHPGLPDPQPDRFWGTGKFFSEIIPKPDPWKFVPRYYRRYGIPPGLFRKILSGLEQPDAILVTSMMTYWYPGVIEAIRCLKESFPGVPVILGGIYARLMREHSLQHSGADHVISSPDLADLDRLLNSLTGASLPASQASDVLSWPDPDYSGYQTLPYACLLTSTGCPNGCSYCSSSFLHPLFMRKPWPQVHDEIIRLLRQRQVRDFAFYDDALLNDRHEHLLPLLRRLVDDRVGVRFHTPNGLHARFIDEETALLLSRSGFTSLRLSFETADAALQASTGGKVTNGELASAVKALRTAGFRRDQIRTYILAGMAGQTLESVRESIRFVREAGAAPVVAAYSMIPGTRDWERYRTEWGLDGMDPVLHNNTVFSAKMGWSSFGELEGLKREARASAVTR